jgi:hypothetical protein
MGSQDGWDWRSEPSSIAASTLLGGDAPASMVAAPVAADADAWTRVSALSIPRYGLAAATGGDGRTYAIGGVLTRAPWFSDAVEAYTPLGAWERVAALPSPAGRLAATTGSDGRVYVVGGEGPAGTLDLLQIYDPADGMWQMGPPMPTARHSLGVVADRLGRIHAIGGCADVACSAGPLDAHETYDSGTNRWTTAASLPQAASGHAVTLGSDGRVYSVGGCGSPTALAAYDPAVNRWGSVGPSTAHHCGIAAVESEAGRILVLGDRSTELYDPDRDRWMELAPLAFEQLSSAVTRGSDGWVYAIGGRLLLAGEWRAVNAVQRGRPVQAGAVERRTNP